MHVTFPSVQLIMTISVKTRNKRLPDTGQYLDANTIIALTIANKSPSGQNRLSFQFSIKGIGVDRIEYVVDPVSL